MKVFSRIAFAGVVCIAGLSAVAQAPSASGEDGLVPIESPRMDKTWLLPGADFRHYRKVLVRKADVTFRRGWLRDVNSNSIRRTNRVTQDDADAILADTRAGFDHVWAESFGSSGFEVVTAPGPDVLELAPQVVDLYVNAPDVPAANVTHTYMAEAGQAALQLDIRDSRTGTLLGRYFDRRETTSVTRPQRTNAVVNRAEFEILYATWARLAAEGLRDLKARSPLPASLKSGQSLAASR